MHPVLRAADHDTAMEGGGHVVGMALELGGEREDVGVELVQVVGRQQTGHDGRGTGAQAAAQRDGGADAELEPVGRMQAFERPDDEVRSVDRHGEIGTHGERPGLHHLELEVERQRCGQHVEARPEVGRGGRYPHHPPAGEAHARTASSTASIRAWHGITDPAAPSAVSGSFRPWPVSTQAMRPASSAP